MSSGQAGLTLIPLSSLKGQGKGSSVWSSGLYLAGWERPIEFLRRRSGLKGEPEGYCLLAGGILKEVEYLKGIHSQTSCFLC